MGLRYEISEVKRESGRPNLGEIEEEVCRVYGVERKYLKGIHRGFWNEPRNVAIYLGRIIGGYKLGEIGDRWGGIKYSSVSGMFYAVKKRLEENRGAVHNDLHAIGS